MNSPLKLNSLYRITAILVCWAAIPMLDIGKRLAGSLNYYPHGLSYIVMTCMIASLYALLIKESDAFKDRNSLIMIITFSSGIGLTFIFSLPYALQDRITNASYLLIHERAPINSEILFNVWNRIRSFDERLFSEGSFFPTLLALIHTLAGYRPSNLYIMGIVAGLLAFLVQISVVSGASAIIRQSVAAVPLLIASAAAVVIPDFSLLLFLALLFVCAGIYHLTVSDSVRSQALGITLCAAHAYIIDPNLITVVAVITCFSFHLSGIRNLKDFSLNLIFALLIIPVFWGYSWHCIHASVMNPDFLRLFYVTDLLQVMKRNLPMTLLLAALMGSGFIFRKYFNRRLWLAGLLSGIYGLFYLSHKSSLGFFAPEVTLSVFLAALFFLIPAAEKSATKTRLLPPIACFAVLILALVSYLSAGSHPKAVMYHKYLPEQQRKSSLIISNEPAYFIDRGLSVISLNKADRNIHMVYWRLKRGLVHQVYIFTNRDKAESVPASYLNRFDVQITDKFRVNEDEIWKWSLKLK